MMNLFLVKWCLQQGLGNNLRGYYVCEFLMEYSRRTSEEILKVRKNIHNLFITIVLIYIIIYIFILFLSFELKIEWRKQKVLRCDQIKAIQEALSGFLMDEVIDLKDVYHYDPKE